MLNNYSLANPVLLDAVASIKPFMSNAQMAVMGSGCRTPEKQYFIDKFTEVAERIRTMPVTYEQDGKGDDAIVYLHYFIGGCDWYITEKDMEGGVLQAFGYTVLHGDVEMAELGYISIKELVEAKQYAYSTDRTVKVPLSAELDLHFVPCTLGEIKKKLGK
ncbi:MAG: hypothetical protein ABL925_10525 [Methylococcales bacterium]